MKRMVLIQQKIAQEYAKMTDNLIHQKIFIEEIFLFRKVIVQCCPDSVALP